MHFERDLKRKVYGPWKDYYIDYSKLKSLLRDEGSDAGSTADASEDEEWTEEDEGAFVEELVNVQLEKVHNFQTKTIESLRESTAECERRLEPIVTNVKHVEGDGKETAASASDQKELRDILSKLDRITTEMNELEKFSRINYAGFVKATKKHDKKRGKGYRMKPLMQVRLKALPFNQEDYSPLLFRVSTMYTFIRQRLDDKSQPRKSFSESQTGREEYTTYKFWVHSENLLELKTVILRRLPVLIYNPQSSKAADSTIVRQDPTVTSIYFDSPSFSLYHAKVDRKENDKAASLRLRWYGQLSETPDVYCEKKLVTAEDVSQEERIIIKQKRVQSFLLGDYDMEKEVGKLKERYGENSDQAVNFQQSVESIKSFTKDNELQPVLRANYTRQAFQIPGDDRVRITLDTNLALIREDALDPNRPCRDPPSDWHRREIDDEKMEYPFPRMRRAEINRFPHALLEIKVKNNKDYEWVNDLMNSHLVKYAPRFSKFIHGVAQLFDEYVNTFPFWLNDIDTDIRRDPHQAYEEEQERKARAAEDEVAVGSFLRHQQNSLTAQMKHETGQLSLSPMSASSMPRSQTRPGAGPRRTTEKATAADTKRAKPSSNGKNKATEADNIDSEDEDIIKSSNAVREQDGATAYFRHLFPNAFKSKSYGTFESAPKEKNLPAGVTEPSFWIKDEGPVKVEEKVWLANQRTFIKWQHVSILLGSLSLALYNAASVESEDNRQMVGGNGIAQTLALVYTLVALFAAGWGWVMYVRRADLIMKRSGRDFDNVLGPLVVCAGLIIALFVNFGLRYQAVIAQKREWADAHGRNRTLLEEHLSI